jgi:hypothetical protein
MGMKIGKRAICVKMRSRGRKAHLQVRMFRCLLDLDPPLRTERRHQGTSSNAVRFGIWLRRRKETGQYE